MAKAEQRTGPTVGSPWRIAEASTFLKVSEDHIRRMVADGRVKSVRLGKVVLIPDGELTRLATKGVS